MNKAFSINQIFDIKKVYGQPQKTYEVGTTPYVTGAKDNNGVVGFVKADETSISKGNCISVDPITGLSCYQPVDFVGRGFSGASINLLYNDNLDEKTALFMCSAIEKVASSVAAYTNLFNSTRLANAKIIVPVIENSNPDYEYTVDDIDWQYMRDRITELERDHITELDAYLQATGLNDYELTEEDKKILFKKVEFTDILIGKLFNKVEAKCKKADFDKRKDTSSLPTNEFCIPLINAKLGDNGIMFYGRKEDWNTQSMCIDVIQNGAVATGKVYVQPQATAVLWDAYLIQPTFDDVTEHSLLYLSRCIEKLTKERFSYEKKATWDRIKECFITIPIKSDGTPDFDYMERYIRAMEKIVIADVVKYKNKVIETTKKVVGE